MIFPIIKDVKKNNTDITNTRPITLSNTITIIFEKYLLSIIQDEYQEDPRQFGFKANSSTNHAIFVLRETAIQYKNKNKAVFACFLDFSKAFDRVNRVILLAKLKEAMDERHWACMYQYYNNSTIRLRGEEGHVSSIQTNIGVKQGGPLSPKLFSIYMDGIFARLNESRNKCTIGQTDSSALLYADDTVLLFETSTGLQQAVNKLVEYCDELEVEINAKKTKLFTTGKRLKNQQVFIKDVEIEMVDKFKYLGWWIEQNLSGKEHLKARKLAATVASYQLKKVGIDNENMSVDLKILLRDTYCRSKLKYALENTHLSEKEYSELNSAESKTLKAWLGLNRYHSNTMLNNAIGITPLSQHIKTRKLKFILELLEYGVTRNIIEDYTQDIKKIPHKSLVKEALRLLAWNEPTIDTETFKSLIHKKIAEYERETAREKETDSSKAIKYLLDKNSCAAKNIVKRLLYWENNTKRKQRGSKKQKPSTMPNVKI